MRITGLASGMDIDSIVKDMMKAQSVPLDKLKQKKQTLEWQRDDYRSMNTLLLNFRNGLLDMKLSSAYRVRTVSSSDESKVTATATGAAGLSSYSISKVERLAKAEVRINTDKIYNGKLDQTKSLYAQNSELPSSVQPVWKTGAVVSQSLTGDGTSDYKLFGEGETNNILEDKQNSWSVKVDGKSYKVVTDQSKLSDSTVFVDNDGNIKFNKSISKDSTIKVDYIGKAKTESLTLGSSTSSWQLSQNGISNLKEIKITKIDGNSNAQPYKTYTVDDDGMIYEGNTKVGELDNETGLITFEPGKIPSSTKDTTYRMEASYQHKYASFSLNTSTSSGEQYENFIITGKESLNNVISKVNGSKVGVSMFYDKNTGKMTMTRSETGTFIEGTMNTSEIRGEGSFLTKILKFDMNETPKEKAVNAKFDINGLSTERSSNTFEMNGVTFTLKQTFDTGSAQPVTIGISNDTNKVYENISNFVKSYNEMIDKIQGKLDEKKYKDYAPLTDDQKESLSDKQQEKWEELAKSGLLRHDSTLSGVLSNMRMDFYGQVKNSEISKDYDQLSKIGITTTADYLSGGKLEINEEKLKKAIEEDPDSIEQLFRGENGITQKLTDTVTKAMDTVKLKAGNSNSTNQTFTIGRELDTIETRQKSLEDRLKDLEDRYYRQFTAMEQAIQKANSQSNYLTQMFSNGN
ncbi:flagellar filament capping protein FliD [Bacillus sp. 1P06AnD]|uniref:flagellar filament capping protein FliD n=1 Tax=Bacillus sp. 1P06AnD TaxID=3132208 RepID=UPI0039A3BA73